MAATGNVGMIGHAPTVLVGPAKKSKKKKGVITRQISGKQVAKLLDISDEQQKYLKVWNVPAYRVVSPGEGCVDMFLEAVRDMMPDHDKQTLIDFGCGTGRAGYKLWQTGKFDVTLMDFAWNCLDDNIKARCTSVKGMEFVEHDITKKTALRANWGYCTDVMEHLPPEEVDDALDVIFEVCDNVFFTDSDH